MKFALLFLFVIVIIRKYFVIAERLKIVDKPNNRSSHFRPTIRGAGVIFFIGWLFWFLVDGFPFPYFTAGAFLIACISFIDDLKAQPAWLRLLIHVLSFLLMCSQLLFPSSEPWWFFLVIFIIGIGTLNAFNFMDGINGMSGAYGLTTMVTLLVIDRRVIDFMDEKVIVVLIITVTVFLFYNFRRNARCFAGDVGSVTLAFMLTFVLLQLMLTSGNYGWLVLFAVYGVETVVTIVYRFFNRENIFKAHRSHVYQYLANELEYPHLLVSLTYAGLQLIINILFITYFPQPGLPEALVLLVSIGLTYVVVRERIMAGLGQKGLLSRIFNDEISNR